jgi:hypothetical protein
VADLSDVEAALVEAIGAAVSGVPFACRVYRGWPVPAALSASLAAGGVDISVFPVPGSTRNTTRWQASGILPPPPPALTVSVAGNAATFGGVASLGQVAGVAVGKATYVHRTAAGDSPELVASILAGAVEADTRCTAMGATLTVAGVTTILARVAADATIVTELRRQAQDIRVSVWAPTPALRDTVAAMVDVGLAGAVFLDLPDRSCARISYRSTESIDDAQDDSLYQRDLILEAEYATTVSGAAPAMLFGDLICNGATFIA